MRDVPQPAQPATIHRLLVNRWLGWLLLVPLVLLIAVTARQAEQLREDPHATTLIVSGDAAKAARAINDFELFYVVGELYPEGNILSAYDNGYLMQAQQRLMGVHSFLPWAYPPQFTAVVALLPLVKISVAFVLFVGGTLALYVFVLSRFDWRYAGAAMLAIYPALILNARLGQNGFLTGCLIGWFLLAYQRRAAGGGVGLGLLVIKPHLGGGLALITLLGRRWSMIVAAAVVVALTSLLATWLLGLAVWPAFLTGVASSSVFLSEGSHALYRLSSVYAGVRSFDLPAAWAFAAQAVGAVLALAAIINAHVRKWPLHRTLALTALCNVFISPYNHDYDLACLAFALVLILPEMLPRMRAYEIAVFFMLCWLGCGAGLAQHFRAVLFSGTLAHPLGSSLAWSFEAMGVLAATLVAVRVLRRPALPGAPGERPALV